MEIIGSKWSYALTWCMPNNDDDDDELLHSKCTLKIIQPELNWSCAQSSCVKISDGKIWSLS